MTKEREALKLALEALEHSHANEPIWKTPHREAITAIKEALADHIGEAAELVRPEQEPVVTLECTYGYNQCRALEIAEKSLTQPKREWGGLTNAQIKKLGDTPTLYSDYEVGRSSFEYLCPYKFARAIEAKLKELNK